MQEPADVEVAIPAQRDGTVTGPEDPKAGRVGTLGRITGRGSSSPVGVTWWPTWGRELSVS